MAYDTIKPASFVPDPAAGPFHVRLQTLAFPPAWRPPILELYRHGKPGVVQARIREVPIRRLNAVLRALAPDLVTADTIASFDNARPWLYAETEYPAAVLTSFVHAWLRDMQPDADTFPLVRQAASQLANHPLQWGHQSVDMLEQQLSEGGTSLPADRLFRLLPDMMAARIASLRPYEHCGQPLSFRRIASDPRAATAELVSWPPLEHLTRPRGASPRAWQYSALIGVSLRTVPFSPIPRLHISTGIRRWQTSRAWLPYGRAVSVHLLTPGALVPDGTASVRFAVAQLTRNRRSGQAEWVNGGPEGMLARLSVLASLPAADDLAENPADWLEGQDGVIAAVTYQTMMGGHGVGAGVMPAERQRLVEWAAEALQPQFRPAPQLTRSSLRPQTPARVLERNLSVPRQTPEDNLAAVAAANQQIASRNAVRRQSQATAAAGEQGLTACILYQSDLIRDHLIRAAEANLGLAESRSETGPGTWSWQTPRLSLRIHTRPLGALGSPLGGDQLPRTSDQLEAAISERRRQVSKHLAALAGSSDGPAQVTFVELDGQDRFAGRSDPKFAIRLGCADAGSVSQFLRPRNPDATDEDDDSPFRAAAAWADGLRQVGAVFTPRHTLGDTIPADLTQVAFWLAKRRADGPTGQAQFTPVAILIRPGQPCIMGKTADSDHWLPYPELLRQLIGRIRAADMRTAEQQQALTAAFVKNTLYQLRSTPTLVVTHAQNTRSRWPWLQNSGLLPDKIRFGDGPGQRLALHGPRLRIARIADTDRNETPQWWAPRPDGLAGIAKGLWIDTEAGAAARVFYSTTGKASTHHLSVETSKLTPHIDAAGKPQIRPGASAWNPGLVEFTIAGIQPADDPQTWAMYLHQQRFPDDHPDGLALPLILHLAALTSQYALPHQEAAQGDAAPGSEEEDSATLADPVDGLEAAS